MTRSVRSSLEGGANDSTPQPGSKKRKASELQDGSELNGHNSLTPRGAKKTTSRKSLPHLAKFSNTGDSVPFSVECPARPADPSVTEDVFRAREDPGVPELAIDYAVRPGNTWANIRAYRNVKLVDQTFTTGQIIYVNRKIPAPQPPPEGAADDDLLRYDKENMWVGMIAQAKAESDKAVFLRVFWLYWPEELPMGRQPYHGQRELIMSNAIDIIDAQTIACAAEVSHWDENDDDHEGNQKERFWRQTLDISKIKPKTTAGLSPLRRHCFCQEYYNPDTTMYKCLRADCGIWNHEECLWKAVLEKAWDKFEKGELAKDLDDLVNGDAKPKDSDKTLSERILSPAETFGHSVKRRIMQTFETAVEEVKHETDVELHVAKVAKRGRPRKKDSQERRWTGKLEATVSLGEDESVQATIRQLVPSSTGKGKKENFEVKEWTVKLDCLKCGRPLD